MSSGLALDSVNPAYEICRIARGNGEYFRNFPSVTIHSTPYRSRTMQLSMRTSTATQSSRVGPRRSARPSPVAARRQSVVRVINRASGCSGPGWLADEVPDREKRTVMNWLLVGALGLPIGAMAAPFLIFFVPKGCGPASPAASHSARVLDRPSET